MKKFLSVLLVLVFALSLVGCGSKPAENKGGDKEDTVLKAALLTSGPINDGGWNTSAYEGLTNLKDKLGFEISYTENVKQDDQENIIRDYAKKGYTLIIGHGFEYGDSLTKVAKEFPDTYFLNVGGMAGGVEPNLSSGVFETGVLGYLAGRLAADVTVSNKIGFVGAMEIPTIVDEVKTIQATVTKFNPSATVTVAYTGSWTDIAAGKEAALAQIAAGCDFVIGIGDACDAGVIQACDEKGVWNFGWAGDMNKLSPNTVITSGVQSVPVVIETYAQMVKDGKWVSEARAFGIKDSAQFLGDWAQKAPAEAKTMVLGEFDKFKSGELDRAKAMEIIGKQD